MLTGRIGLEINNNMEGQMGRKKKSETTDATNGQGHNGSTGLDRAKVAEFIGRVENLHGDLDTEQSEYMTRCKAIREDIAEIYQEAKDTAGISKKAFKAKVKERLLKKKMANCRDNLESEQMDMFDLLSMALGEVDGPASTTERKTFAEQIREPGAPLAEGTAHSA